MLTTAFDGFQASTVFISVDDAASDDAFDSVGDQTVAVITADDDEEDVDKDCMPDAWESRNNLDPNNSDDKDGDNDGDGLSNYEEFNAGNDPGNKDSDGDGMPDKWEKDNGLNPSYKDDAKEAFDTDNYDNLAEYLAGTDLDDSDSKPCDPRADAGIDRTVTPGDIVCLDGLNSSVADGTITEYAWEQVEGYSVTLEDKNLAQCFFTVGIDTPVYIVFELRVTDNKGLESTDTVIVNVVWNKKPPVANKVRFRKSYRLFLLIIDTAKAIG